MDIPKITANFEAAQRRLQELGKVDNKVGGAPHLALALCTVQGWAWAEHAPTVLVCPAPRPPVMLLPHTAL